MTTFLAPPIEVDVQGILDGISLGDGAVVVVHADQLLSMLTIANHQTRDNLGNVRPGRAALWLMRDLRAKGCIRTPHETHTPEATL